MGLLLAIFGLALTRNTENTSKTPATATAITGKRKSRPILERAILNPIRIRRPPGQLTTLKILFPKILTLP